MMQAIFGKKSVAGVLAAFNKTLDELKTVEAEQEAEAVKQSQVILEAQAAHDAAVQEASLARTVAARLTDVIKPAIGDMTLSDLVADAAQ